jgi:hypothetical protein
LKTHAIAATENKPWSPRAFQKISGATTPWSPYFVTCTRTDMFILSKQLDADDADAHVSWRRYQDYLHSHQQMFPASAYSLATSEWFFGSDDHRAPHDSWLESMSFEEHSIGERNEIRFLSLRVRLLAAYHDQYIELFYPQVFSYSLDHPKVHEGHFDWRYHELRISDSGNLIHEIEWAGRPGIEGRWLLEVSDLQASFMPRVVNETETGY